MKIVLQAVAIYAAVFVALLCMSVTTGQTRKARAENANATCMDAHQADCREVRTLHAAEWLNVLTERGIYVSAIGTFAFVVTVVLTAIATRAATRAADAALAAVEHARMTSDRELRPYMAISPVLNRHFDEFEQSKFINYSLGLRYQNIGRLPATHCVTYSRYLSLTGPLSVDFDYPTIGSTVSIDLLVQQDGATVDFPKEAVNAKELRKAFAKEMIMMVYGWVDYSQPGSLNRYRTEYAAHVDVTADPLSGSDKIITVRTLGPFNGMDGVCFHQPETFRKEQSQTTTALATIPGSNSIH